MYDVAIIGAGICGAAVAYELSQKQVKVVVIEANDDVAKGTTRANSALIHAGYDPEPGTLMAATNVLGNRLWGEIGARLNVPIARVGSLVVAFSPEELQTLEELKTRGEQNGVVGLEILNREALFAREPNLHPDAVGALLAPSAGVVDPMQACLALCNFAHANGVAFLLQSPVTAIQKQTDGFCITAGDNRVCAKTVVNAAGLYADKVYELAGGSGLKINAVRGEYFVLDKSEFEKVNAILFRCPTKAGKGVVVTPTIHGNILAGPTAQDVADPGDTATTMTGQNFVREVAPGMVPSLDFSKNIRNYAGNRANLKGHEDFVVAESDAVAGFVNLAGIKSPGLTSAPAIAKRVVEILRNCGVALEQKKEITEYARPAVFKELPAAQKAEWIAKDPRYGRVICRCETVTEGEIIAALGDGLCPPTVSAVKRRCLAGMGRCQGGFCSVRVHEIIARERGLAHDSVTLDGGEGVITIGETKGASR